MKKYNLAKNTISASLSQLVTIVCGLVLPRLILQCYGSSVNGLVNSISQFLSAISFLELGVGAVTQTALYGPLANGDIRMQSEVYVSARRFFSKIARILVVYIGILTIAFPFMSSEKCGFTYTATLIVAMGISSFLQYYFGIVNSLFLSADQKSYIQYNLQIITLIINTVCSAILMKCSASIQVVKLSTAVIYCVRPFFLNLYVKKNYHLDINVKVQGEPIKQKWNGIAQHIAAIVFDSTDIIILTVFSTLKDVSVYSVYYLVVSAIKQLFNTVTSGIQSILGDLYVRDDKNKFKQFFYVVEWAVHTLTVFIMGCTSQLIVPFVLVYTKGVNDANYNQSFFGYIITLAYGLYCLRLPYHMMIRASGKYKETQGSYIYSAIMNIVISAVMVKKFGLIGVAVGTSVAMGYQVLWLLSYVYKNIIFTSKKHCVKLIVIDAISSILGIIVCGVINIATISNWGSLIISGVITTIIWGILVVAFNFLFYREYMISVCKRIFNR